LALAPLIRYVRGLNAPIDFALVDPLEQA